MGYRPTPDNFIIQPTPERQVVAGIEVPGAESLDSGIVQSAGSNAIELALPGERIYFRKIDKVALPVGDVNMYVVSMFHVLAVKSNNDGHEGTTYV